MRTISNTIGISFYQLAASFPIPIFLALAMNASYHRMFARSVQLIVYLPPTCDSIILNDPSVPLKGLRNCKDRQHHG